MATQFAADEVQGTQRRNDGKYYLWIFAVNTFSEIILYRYVSIHKIVFVQTMENRFEILLDCKNNHIDVLLKDLEDAEEQNLRQYGAHAEVIFQFLSK